MKKIRSAAVISVILGALLLCACAEKSKAGDNALNFPDMEWGMTWEEVMSAGSIAEENISENSQESEYSAVYLVDGYEVFGEKSVRTNFNFIDLGGGTKELVNVVVQYPEDADMEQVLKEMTKVYGSTVAEMTDYAQFSALGDDSRLTPTQYTESEQMKIWAGAPIGEAVPEKQNQEYMKMWQEKVYPVEGSNAFQYGLTDEQWDEFTENARMAMVLWLSGAQMYDGENTLYFNAANSLIFEEVTRRISE